MWRLGSWCILFLIFIVGCVSAQAQDKDRQRHWERHISMYHDDDRRVTCWILDDGALVGGGNSAISCLPDHLIYLREYRANKP